MLAPSVIVLMPDVAEAERFTLIPPEGVMLADGELIANPELWTPAGARVGVNVTAVSANGMVLPLWLRTAVTVEDDPPAVIVDDPGDNVKIGAALGAVIRIGLAEMVRPQASVKVADS